MGQSKRIVEDVDPQTNVRSKPMVQVKERLGSIDIFMPHCQYDCRVSISCEFPLRELEGDMSEMPAAENIRHKDRVSAVGRDLRVDLTKVLEERHRDFVAAVEDGQVLHAQLGPSFQAPLGLPGRDRGAERVPGPAGRSRQVQRHDARGLCALAYPTRAEPRVLRLGEDGRRPLLPGRGGRHRGAGRPLQFAFRRVRSGPAEAGAARRHGTGRRARGTLSWSDKE
jgi:hypothetical protein